MIHNKRFSRREFGSIAAAGLAYAATGKKLLTPDAEDNTGVLSSPAVTAAKELIAAGQIGAIHLGCSSIGACNTVSDTHEKQLLLLCEILQPGQADAMQSIAIPATSGNTECFRTLMTTLVFSSGIRIAVTSTADSISATGCVIRGDRGSIHLLEDHLAVVSTKDHVQQEIQYAACAQTQLPQSYAALVRQVMYDAQERISA